jgi:ElaA protein
VVIVPASLHVCGFGSLDPATLYALLRLRVDVFVVEQECPYPELDGRDEEQGTVHLWAADDDDVGLPPVAYLRMLQEPDGSRRIGRVCVAAGHRGSGLAGRLIDEALRLAGRDVVVLDAQSYLRGWYERLGFGVSGPEFVEDGIPHLPMRRPPLPPHVTDVETSRRS